MTRLTLAAAVLAATVFLAACGSSGGGETTSPTPLPTASSEESAYFQALQAAMRQIREESTALADFRSHAFDPGLSEADRRSRGSQYGSRYAAFASGRQARLSAISAPDRMKSLHTRLTDAAAAVKQLSGDLTARLAAQPVSSAADLSTLFIELDATTVEQRFRDACTDLQRRGNGLGVSVDLGCS